MAQFEVVIPKMGESIVEASILKWLKQEGDTIEVDETLLEVATDKVDSEVPSPVAGRIIKILSQVNETVAIGKAVAIVETEAHTTVIESKLMEIEPEVVIPSTKNIESGISNTSIENSSYKLTDRFYSPLVRTIAKQENISPEQLSQIQGTGSNGRLTKRDIVDYINQPNSIKATNPAPIAEQISIPTVSTGPSISATADIIEMDRMRKLIADHMVMSKKVSPHVTSFVEINVTALVRWRNKAKDVYAKKYNQKLTFTPIFVEAVARAIKDYPMINVSVDGHKIIMKKDINIGMAAALPSGNLIVPVIKNADRLNLAGITHQVNELAERARINKLKPEEIQDGTFTLTNVGTFGNIMGTPIINQPQVAILATGIIQKKPIVIEGENGDSIGIGQMMFLSLSYDHRVVDGALGGAFLRRVGDYLENWDINQII